MFVVDKSKCDFTVDGRTVIAEASQMGLRPGEWPDFISIVDGHVGFLFGPNRQPIENDPQNGYIYFSGTSSLELHILND